MQFLLALLSWGLMSGFLLQILKAQIVGVLGPSICQPCYRCPLLWLGRNSLLLGRLVAHSPAAPSRGAMPEMFIAHLRSFGSLARARVALMAAQVRLAGCISQFIQSFLNLFQRAWCVAELAEAHRLGMAQKPFPKEQGHLNDMAIHFATGGEYEGPEDVQQIFSKIPNNIAFNQKLQELMFDGNVGLLAAWKKADVLQQMEDISHVLKWGVSASVDNGALIWRTWVASAGQCR